MDPSFYKFHTVSRDLTYHYYYRPSVGGKSTLLFLHGFPASSYDWRKQITHFQLQGYGILAPDLLGYGKSSKPEDATAFRMNAMAGDIISILDAEGLESVVGISHDWGSVLLARLSILYTDRFLAFAWLSLSFLPPYTEKWDLYEAMAEIKEILGYECYAYWEYFVKESSHNEIKANIESFMQLLYPKDPSYWLTYMCLPGKTEEWMRNNMQPGRPDYLTNDEFEKICADFVNSGVTSPICWYASQVNNVDLKDNQAIPNDSLIIKKPSFFAAALKDAVCTAAMGKDLMQQFGSSVTIEEFDTGHWVHLQRSQEVNEAIEKWLLELNL